MKFEEYYEKLLGDPEYIAAEKELKPLFDLASEILRYRLKNGWSQTELARRSGTKQTNISRIESGLANPTIKFIQKVARALGAEIEIRFNKEPESTQKQVIEPARVKSSTDQTDGSILIENWPTTRTKRTAITTTYNDFASKSDHKRVSYD
jgi:transcriptional regulator with XRE-family HTH domain